MEYFSKLSHQCASNMPGHTAAGCVVASEQHVAQSITENTAISNANVLKVSRGTKRNRNIIPIIVFYHRISDNGDTVVVDLDGKTAVPGFIDSHGHARRKSSALACPWAVTEKPKKSLTPLRS